MSERRLSEEETLELIMSVLRAAKKPLMTKDVHNEIQKRFVSCPDSVPVLLNRLKLKGVVKGQLSIKRKGWVWWIEAKG